MAKRQQYIRKQYTRLSFPLGLKSWSDLGKKLAQITVCLEVKLFASWSPELLCLWSPFDIFVLGVQLAKREVSPIPPFLTGWTTKNQVISFFLALGKEGVSHPHSKLRKEVSFPQQWEIWSVHAAFQCESEMELESGARTGGLDHNPDRSSMVPRPPMGSVFYQEGLSEQF